MPQEIGWRPADETKGGFSPVDDENPFPVYLPPNQPPVIALGRLLYVPPFIVPGITAADALDAGDAMGSVFSIAVPTAGAIVKAQYYDADDEGISKELWLFRMDVTTGAPASDAAFALTDQNLLQVVDVLTFTTFRDATNGQVSMSVDVPCWYAAPGGYLWMHLKTTGADNIAAGSMPMLSFTIERYDLG